MTTYFYMKSAIFRFQANNALQEENNFIFYEKKGDKLTTP